MWNILGIVKRGDYLNAIVPDHPKATQHGYVLLHRVIVENHIGKLLSDDEIVHHRDHDRFNNNITNLQVMSRAEHSRIHGYEQYVNWILLQCPHCGQLFEREARNTHWIKRSNIFTTCSRSCAASFGNYVSKHGIDWYVSIRLDQNIQGWYLKHTLTEEMIEF